MTLEQSATSGVKGVPGHLKVLGAPHLTNRRVLLCLFFLFWVVFFSFIIFLCVSSLECFVFLFFALFNVLSGVLKLHQWLLLFLLF